MLWRQRILREAAPSEAAQAIAEDTIAIDSVVVIGNRGLVLRQPSAPPFRADEIDKTLVERSRKIDLQLFRLMQQVGVDADIRQLPWLIRIKGRSSPSIPSRKQAPINLKSYFNEIV
jgi:hypothetical protein